MFFLRSRLLQQMPPKLVIRSQQQPSTRAACGSSHNQGGSRVNVDANGVHEDEVSQTRNHTREDDLPPPLAIDLAQVMVA